MFSVRQQIETTISGIWSSAITTRPLADAFVESSEFCILSLKINTVMTQNIDVGNKSNN